MYFKWQKPVKKRWCPVNGNDLCDGVMLREASICYTAVMDGTFTAVVKLRNLSLQKERHSYRDTLINFLHGAECMAGFLITNVSSNLPLLKLITAENEECQAPALLPHPL